MKPPIILLMTADPAVETIAREAVLSLRHGLRTARSASEAFQDLESGWEDIDAAIVDLDPGMHGAALLEAANGRFPVIVLTSLEANYMRPVASRHGAQECLTKPLDAEHLREALKRLLGTRC
jgi:DNA-binding response OmpR family regulator